MTGQEALPPDQQKQQQQEQLHQPKAQQKEQQPSVAEEVQEMCRKLEKARSVLHTAGDVEVGQTPCEILHETRAYRLLHYQQMVSKTDKTPILVVYALINKSYVLDLQSDKSWVRSLLSQGFDVYLLDWKTPTTADKYVSFDDYVNEYLNDCVDIVLKKTKTDKLTLHGYCMGASMSVMYTTLHQEKVRNLAVIAPVIDTEKDTTVIGNLAKNMDVNKMLYVIGNLPVEQLYSCYSLLKPFKQGVNKYFNLVQNIDNDQFVGNFLRIDKRLMRFHTGHVGLIASLYSQNNVLPKVGQWLKARSQ